MLFRSERPGLCLGTDSFHTPEWLRAGAVRSGRAVLGADALAWNTPFAGCYVPLDKYRVNADVTALMLEYRRDIVADHFGDAVSVAAMLVDVCESPLA